MGIHMRFGSEHGENYSSAQNSRTAGKKGTIMMGIICLIVGLFCLWFYFYGSNDAKHTDYVVTTGYVYDYDEYWDSSDGHYMYKIIVKYEVDGEEYRVKSNSSTTHPKKLNSYVEVKYDPNNPSEAFISGKDEGNWLIILVGVLFSVVSLPVLYKGIKMPSEKKKIENSSKEDI